MLSGHFNHQFTRRQTSFLFVATRGTNFILSPQHWILNHPNYLLLKDLGIAPKRLSIFKMDRAEDMEAFALGTGFDFSQRANSTGKIKPPPSISPKSLEIINSIYKQDFDSYGYEMRLA